MADLLSGLVALLKADAATALLIGDRAFGGELPAPETVHMPRRCLVVRASGGPSMTGGSYAGVDAQRIDLFGYGATPAEAAIALDAGAMAFRLTRRSVHAGVLIHAINSAGGFSQARDPDTGWPRAFRSFQVFHALNSI